MNEVKFKAGDSAIILGKPKSWYIALNGDCPGEIHKDDFPFRITIKEIGLDWNYVSMTCGNYKWDLTSLIKDNLIELYCPYKIKRKRIFK